MQARIAPQTVEDAEEYYHHKGCECRPRKFWSGMEPGSPFHEFDTFATISESAAKRLGIDLGV